MSTRLLLASTCALALVAPAAGADLPAAAPPPPAPVFTWAGVYLGGQVGYAWGADKGYISGLGPLGPTVQSVSITSSASLQGLIGGIHIGNNWQVNQFVFGLEGEVDGTTLSKTIAPTVYFSSRTRSPVQGSIRGRAGIAFDRTLLYATGGLVYAGILNSYSVLGANDNFRWTRSGWTVGGGIEYALNNNWSVRAEYRYSNFGFFYDGQVVYPGIFQGHRWTENQVKAGFSYKFVSSAPPAVVAKY